MLKKSIFVLLFALGFIGLQAQTMKITDPVKYNDYIVDQQNRIGDELLKLIAMFDALPEDQQVTTDQLEVVISTAKSAITNLNNLKVIPNEFGLKAAAGELFAFYQRIMDTDYRTVLDQLYAETPDMALLQEILVRIQEEEGKIDKNFQEKQQEFAKYHNIQLEENRLQEEFDEAEEGN